MEQTEQAMGQMLYFFKQIAVPPAPFQAYMDFEVALQGGAAFDQLTREAVYIGTSDYNGCTRSEANEHCRRLEGLIGPPVSEMKTRP
jgi:alkylhydroperoxidase family enzyme